MLRDQNTNDSKALEMVGCLTLVQAALKIDGYKSHESFWFAFAVKASGDAAVIHLKRIYNF
jgi:hypothetical protein